MNKQAIYTASQARDNLYNLIKDASSGLSKPEITLKGSDPVILISKSEHESWLETLSLSDRERRQALEPINESQLTDINDLS